MTMEIVLCKHIKSKLSAAKCVALSVVTSYVVSGDLHGFLRDRSLIYFCTAANPLIVVLFFVASPERPQTI